MELECIAPNRWKDVRVDGLYLKTPQNGEYEAVAPGEIDRNIPGWDLAFFIFDKLISGCCYAFQTAPNAAILAHKKWVRFNIDKANICTEAMDPDVDLFHLVVGLELNTDDNGTWWKNSTDQEAYIKTVSSLLFDENFVLSAVCKKPESVPESKINPEWWSLKNKVFCDDSESEMHHCCYHDH